MATSNETFGIMKPNEELVVRCTQDGRGYFTYIRKMDLAYGGPHLKGQGITGGAVPTIYTSAATLATAVQNALPTLES